MQRMIVQRVARERTPKPSVRPPRILASIVSLEKKVPKQVHPMRLLPVQIAVLTNTVLVRNKIQPLALAVHLAVKVQEALQSAVNVLQVKLRIQRRKDVINVDLENTVVVQIMPRRA